MQLYYMHKESIPSYCTVLFICWTFSDMFQPDFIGRLQRDLCNVCSVCLNLTVIVFTYDYNRPCSRLWLKYSKVTISTV
jgi:hypothetical protein